MDLFPDGAFVRLRSRAREGLYVHADEDGVGVSLSPIRASLNVAWRVQRITIAGTTCVLLHGAAYGRYLATTDEGAPKGHRGQRVVQGIYDNPAGIHVIWTVQGVASGEGERAVLLCHISYRFLRANGRYRTKNTGVTVDYEVGNRGTMMQWVVEAIPLLPEPPALEPQAPLPPPTFSGYSGGGCFLTRPFRRRTVPLPQRTIRYVRATNLGTFNELAWASFQFHGRSVDALRTEVAMNVGEDFYFFNITVCARAGRYGRLTPLTVNLPRSHEPMDIVALNTGSPAATALQYPDVDAP